MDCYDCCWGIICEEYFILMQRETLKLFFNPQKSTKYSIKILIYSVTEILNTFLDIQFQEREKLKRKVNLLSFFECNPVFFTDQHSQLALKSYYPMLSRCEV